MNIGEILKHRGLITEDQLATALQSHERGTERLEDALVRLGYVEQADVLKTLAEQMGLPFVDLAGREIDPAILEGIPPKFIFQNNVVPIEKHDGVLRVATADPLDISPFDELRMLVGAEIEPVVASPQEIERLVKKLFGVGAETVDQMIADRGQQVEVLREDDAAGEGDLDLAADASLINFVNQILIEGLQSRASDIHVEPFENQLRIRYRIDGVLHDAGTPEQIKVFQAAMISRVKIMANLDVAEKRLPQDGRIMLRIAGREIDVRVSVIPTVWGEGVVLRILERTSVYHSLGDLGMSESDLARFSKFVAQPHGIILVTGPTGSGKTTSLYAALSKINTMDRKIITIEEPVEYQIEGINQIQVRPDIGLTFASGLRHILRHDPDVIMVGEIRDLEAAEIAIQAALTGHLVFSTVHTNDAAGAVTRLIDMGIEPYLVASTVEGIMAQRLVRTICEDCKEERGDADEHLSELATDHVVTRHFHGRGCEVCLHTGYYGRTGLFEILPMTESIRELTLARTASTVIKERARAQGMRTLREDGLDKVEKGATTLEEVLRVAKEDET